MKIPNLMRYGLWLAVLETALANRRKYHMGTTWLPHLLMNTLSLFLPDLLRLGRPSLQGAKQPDSAPNPEVAMLEELADRTIADNPSYAGYVAPLAIGYIISNPRFNIYQGPLAEKRFAGLGLDAIPHSATAFGLAALCADTAGHTAQAIPPDHPIYPLVKWIDAHSALFSGLVVATITLVWEAGEYRTHVHELAIKHGDVTKINMQWSIGDTFRDCVANMLGWAAAMIVRHLRGSQS